MAVMIALMMMTMMTMAAPMAMEHIYIAAPAN